MYVFASSDDHFLSTIQAYDGHMNLILSDVEETIMIVDEDAPGGQDTVSVSVYWTTTGTYQKNGNQVAKRKMDMLFVRGDGVILVRRHYILRKRVSNLSRPCRYLRHPERDPIFSACRRCTVVKILEGLLYEYDLVQLIPSMYDDCITTLPEVRRQVRVQRLHWAMYHLESRPNE
jgi:U6 snRNA-associated Sm-like protein LSm3